MFGSEEDEASHAYLPTGNTIPPHTLCGTLTSQFSECNESIAERDIDGHLSLSKLFGESMLLILTLYQV